VSPHKGLGSLKERSQAVKRIGLLKKERTPIEKKKNTFKYSKLKKKLLKKKLRKIFFLFSSKSQKFSSGK